MHGEAQHVARPVQTHLQNSRDYCKPPNRCELPVHKMNVEYANFRQPAPKISYHSNNLERLRKDGRSDHSYPHVYVSWSLKIWRRSVQYIMRWSPTRPLKRWHKLTSALWHATPGGLIIVITPVIFIIRCIPKVTRSAITTESEALAFTRWQQW